jgi:glutathione S-transferase
VEPDDKQRATLGFGSFRAVLDTLEHAVNGKRYLAGGRFSAADVYVGSQIGWGLQFGTLEARPALVAYWNGLSGREAHHRASALDDAAGQALSA